jgi:hypothetical protein
MLSLMHFISVAEQLTGICSKKKGMQIFLCCEFSMLFQNLNSIERDETHHVVISYNSVFFLCMSQKQKANLFQPKFAKAFFCMHKILHLSATLEKVCTELGNEHT